MPEQEILPMENKPENLKTCAFCGAQSEMIDVFRPHSNPSKVFLFGICFPCFDEPDLTDRIEAAYELAFEGVTIQ